MKEDFVSFDLAKKLTLKGFNAPCIAYYDEGVLRYNTKYPFALTAEELLISHNSEYTWVDAPTISQVLKWLREEKKIHVGIVLTPMDLYKPVIGICKGFGNNIDSISPRCFYEEAAIAGIEYVIDNLI